MSPLPLPTPVFLFVVFHLVNKADYNTVQHANAVSNTYWRQSERWPTALLTRAPTVVSHHVDGCCRFRHVAKHPVLFFSVLRRPTVVIMLFLCQSKHVSRDVCVCGPTVRRNYARLHSFDVAYRVYLCVQHYETQNQKLTVMSNTMCSKWGIIKTW